MPTKGVARRCSKINSEFNNDVYDKWRKAKLPLILFCFPLIHKNTKTSPIHSKYKYSNGYGTAKVSFLLAICRLP